MRFLTDMQEVQQYKRNMYFTKHNQIFEDSEGVLHLTPRYLRTDGYTIFDILAPIAGGRFEEDIRCSSAHDLWCRYKQDIQITISEARMLQEGILKEKIKKYPDDDKKPILVAENIPVEYLKIVPINFWKTNKLFNEMLRANGETGKFKTGILSAGVYLNIGWWLGSKEYNNKLDVSKIYNDFL